VWSKKSLVFISSADWMTHKIDKRVEVMVPIKAPYLRKQILEEIINPYLNDQTQTWVLQSEGAYRRSNQGQGLNVHKALLNH